MHLRDPNLSPPGQFRFTHPGGFVSSGLTLGTLVSKVAQYRHNRGLPMVSDGFARLVDEVEAAICGALSPVDRQLHCDTGVKQVTGVHWKAVKRFLVTMVGWTQTGFSTVDQAEAERRASVCINCPMNVSTTGCAICKSALTELRESITGLHTSHDDKLKACGVCSCDLKTIVHVPLEILDKGSGDLVYPEICWKAKSGPNVQRQQPQPVQHVEDEGIDR